jgi:4-hydroxyphenylacetate 3-monooxygenase
METLPTVDVTNQLMTGSEYLASLGDDRSVYLFGERVRNIAGHPAFRNAARSIAQLYDALHDSSQRDALTTLDRTGVRTHRFFTSSYSAQELVAARDAIARWSRLSYGFMGRTPDYKAAFMATLGSNPDFYAPYDGNARAWYRRYASKALFLNHVLINPPVDRNKPVHEVADVFVHVVRETDGGAIISGAKMLATASALTHATFVAQNSAVSLEAGKADDYALVFIAPMDTPGTKLLCRRSYEQDAHSPFDHPLSSRFDENDAVLVFDEAFIPWENFLVYRDVTRANSFYPASGFFNRFNLQAGTRLAVKLDFMTGLLARGLEINGTDGFRGVQAALGQVIAWRSLLWALTTAMASDPEPGANGTVVPKLDYAATLRIFATSSWPAVKSIFEEVLGGAPIVAPSGREDLLSADLRPLIDRFYRGTGASAEERIKLYKLVWDAIGTEFGGRHELYERNYAGNNEQIRVDAMNFARRSGALDDCLRLVDRCLSDYDLTGWLAEPWRSQGSD